MQNWCTCTSPHRGLTWLRDEIHNYPPRPPHALSRYHSHSIFVPSRACSKPLCMRAALLSSRLHNVLHLPLCSLRSALQFTARLQYANTSPPHGALCSSRITVFRFTELFPPHRPLVCPSRNNILHLDRTLHTSPNTSNSRANYRYSLHRTLGSSRNPLHLTYHYFSLRETTLGTPSGTRRTPPRHFAPHRTPMQICTSRNPHARNQLFALHGTRKLASPPGTREGLSRLGEEGDTRGRREGGPPAGGGGVSGPRAPPVRVPPLPRVRLLHRGGVGRAPAGDHVA